MTTAAARVSGSTPHKTMLLYNVVKNQSDDTTPRELACLDLIVGMVSDDMLEGFGMFGSETEVMHRSRIGSTYFANARRSMLYILHDRPSLLGATGTTVAIQHAAARSGQALLLACA